MMPIPTGYTINKIFLSQDINFNPITGVTFFNDVFQNGIELAQTALTVSTSLVDGTIGAFLQSWSASTTGDYQIYTQTISGETIINAFMSETYNVLPNGSFERNYYVGL